MDTLQSNQIQPHLIELRDKLVQTMGSSPDRSQFAGLISEIDAALQKIDSGTYGICEQCRQPIEEDYLKCDPLVRICLSHMSEEQRLAIEKDLELAYKIQNNLLPGAQPHLDAWDIDYYYEPKGPLGGDFYDIIRTGRNKDEIFFIFGDVSGKGISAALLMSNLNAIFRTLAAAELPLKDLIETANRLFCNSTLPAHFATVVCGRAVGTGTIELSNAGHCRPLFVCGSGVTAVESTGLPIGINYSGSYEVKTKTLDTGGMIFLYTDGLTETMNSSDEQYGEDRLSEFLSRNHSLASPELVKLLLEDVTSFRGKEPLIDDLTIMTIRRK